MLEQWSIVKDRIIKIQVGIFDQYFYQLDSYLLAQKSNKELQQETQTRLALEF